MRNLGRWERLNPQNRHPLHPQYVKRIVDNELNELLPHLPAILLDGPKGVGKTETALQRSRTVRRLDRGAEQQIAAADPDGLLIGDRPVLIDEWQRVPAV